MFNLYNSTFTVIGFNAVNMDTFAVLFFNSCVYILFRDNTIALNYLYSRGFQSTISVQSGVSSLLWQWHIQGLLLIIRLVLKTFVQRHV